MCAGGDGVREEGVQQISILPDEEDRGPQTQACHGMFTFQRQGHAIPSFKAEPR